MSLSPEQGDLWAEVKALRERVETLERSDRLIASSVGAGGLTVKDGGTITVEDGRLVILDAAGNEAIVGEAGALTVSDGDIVIEDADGVTVATLGTDGLSLDGTTLEVNDGTVRFDDAADNKRVFVGAFTFNDTATYGLLVYDAAGNIHFITGDTGAGYGFDFRDLAGNTIIVPDRTAGVGLSRPYLNLPMVPTDFVNKRSTTSTAFDGLFKSLAEIQHAGWRADVAASADSGTAGEWRLYDTTDAVALGSARSISDGFSGTDVATGTFPADSYGEHHVVELQVRVTSGGGSVGIEPLAFYGRQS